MITAALTAATFLLALALVVLHVYHRARRANADTAWRIAMEFIAFEASEMPHEFAACYLAKNHDALAQKFPQWAEFAEERAQDWDAAE